MDRNSLQLVLLAVAVFFLTYSFFGKGCGHDNDERGAGIRQETALLPLPAAAPSAAEQGAPAVQPPGQPCVIESESYRAEAAAVGGGLSSFQLTGRKFQEGGRPIDMADRTTKDTAGVFIPDYAPLRVQFRNNPAAHNQVPGDLIEFTTERKGNACVLRHATPGLVEIVRTMRPSARPYELEVDTTITNLADGPRQHQFSTALYGLQLKAQEGGFLSQPSPNNAQQPGCSVSGRLERKDRDSLLKGWFVKEGQVDFVALSTSYLGQAVMPLSPDGSHCALVAENRGDADSKYRSTLFRAVLAWKEQVLAPGASTTYRVGAFLGPKERSTLAAAGGSRHLEELIDLGTFSVIAKILVRFLAFVHGVIGSWGLAIIVLTITVRAALIPLTLPQVRSAIAMRRLKPRLDEINAKYADDAQGKMLATQALYKENGINPLAGCIPALIQMPVWFALYTALQTAMELYHEPFFIWPDLSSPDPRFVLPLILGATMFFQQKVTPMQMDPAQQKMFLYFMPAMFTVFMLFLPAGLGVYMLTNSILGIAQTLVVERHMRAVAATTGADVKVTSKGGAEKRPLSGAVEKRKNDSRGA